MSQKELEDLKRALRELTLENNTKEKAVQFFQTTGYFDENGELAKEYRQPE